MYGEFMFTVTMPRICHDQGTSLPLSRVGNVKSIAAVVTDPDCILSQSVFLRVVPRKFCFSVEDVSQMNLKQRRN